MSSTDPSASNNQRRPAGQRRRSAAHMSQGQRTRSAHAQASRQPHERQGQRRAQAPRPQQRTPHARTQADQRSQRIAPAAYRTNNRQPRRRKRVSPVVVVVAILATAAVAVGGFFLVRQIMSFNVTVNGQEVKVYSGDKASKLIDEGYASPKPGNLLAVDGSMLTEGGGAIATVTINGEEASVDSELSRDAVVQIDDGGDTTEDAETTEEPIPFEKKNDDTSFGAYWNGSIHLLSDGKDGVKTVKTGTKSGLTVSEVTTPPINAGYRIYTAKPSDKVIALTFDDGPWPETTEQILDILEANGAKATFFTIGNQIANVPEAVKRASQMGCQICTHTWDHAEGSGGGVDLTQMSASEQIDEVQKGFQAIAEVLGEEPAHILRAPGGNFHDEIIDTLWDYVDAEIGWDVDTEDWSRPGVESISNMIMSVQPGQVILMHDGGGDRSQTVEALSQCLPKLVEEGYSFVTINELLAYGMPE